MTSSSERAGERRDVGQIGSVLGAVADRHVDQPSLDGRRLRQSLGERAHLRLQPRRIHLQRIEVQRDGAVADDDVAHRAAAPVADRAPERDDPGVGRGIDPRRQLDEQRRVAGRDDSQIAASSHLAARASSAASSF